MTNVTLPSGREHLAALRAPLAALEDDCDRVDAWGRHLARVLLGGGRLLVAGNGGSAAQAQHLTAELVGRYRDDRVPLSALALHSDTSTVTAVLNDYGGDQVYARQVRAHGRPGDVFLAMSTSGRSTNVLSAVRTARHAGLVTWALTGPLPNPIADVVDDAVAVEADATATIKEIHQNVVHQLCAAVDLDVAATLAHAAGAVDR